MLYNMRILQYMSKNTHEQYLSDAHQITKLRGFGPVANYADRATAVCWRSSANFCG
jgi:hypothetical protein